MNKIVNNVFKSLVLLSLLFALVACNIEQKEDIFIVYTNDVGGEVNAGVGYSGVKAVVNNLKKDSKYVSLVDAGDNFEGPLTSSGSGESILTLMNAVGYDVVTLGNQDFSLGLNELSSLIKSSSFSYVSCNIKYLGSGKNPLEKVKPYVIKRYGWTKVAFIGITTPETILRDGKPSYLSLMKDGEPLYYLYEDNEGQALYEQVQKTVDSVRKKVDYVIVLSHLGSNSTLEGFSSYDVIANTTGIDVMIDGHSHTVVSGEAVANKDGEIVGLTSTGQQLENVGVLTLHPDKTFNTVLYPIVYEKDESIQALIDSLVD